MKIKELIRSNILSLEPYCSAREIIQEGILLDANENPYEQYWKGIQLNRYPDPNQIELRQEIASFLGVKTENVLAGSGSDEVLDWIFKLFCQPGQDQVAIAEPTYGMYSVSARIFGIPVVEFPLNNKFDFDVELFLDGVSENTKVLFLCSPNNPTGNLLDREQIVTLCRRWGKIVVVDEAYIEFADASSIVYELSKVPNLIVLRTLSKAFGRAGVRLGYAVASEQIINYFLKVKLPYNLNVLTTRNGCQTLKESKIFRSNVESIKEERERIFAELSGIEQIVQVFPSQANFLLFRCPKASQIYLRLLEKGIVVRDRSSLLGLKDCIRVSIGTSAENSLFLKELRRVL